MILLPSRRRTERLKKFFKAAKATNTTSPGIVIVDFKDYIDNADVYLEIERDHFIPNWGIVISKAESMGGKLRELWPFYKDLSYVGLLGDDNVPISIEWDKKLIDQLDGTNFISCNDDWCFNGKKTLPAGLTVWSGELLRAVNYLYPPGLNHQFIDTLWRDIGLAEDCWIVDESVIVGHEHASRKDEWKDETSIKAESLFNEDRVRYSQWIMGGEFKMACEAVRKLKNGTS